MSDVLKTIRDYMEKKGIPGRDAYDLPTSTKTFPDGANYRIEIAGVERASTMAAMIDEAHKRNVTIHRCIAAVGGSTYCDFEELKAMARMAHDEKIEMIMTVGHRKGWDRGLQGDLHGGGQLCRAFGCADRTTFPITSLTSCGTLTPVIAASWYTTKACSTIL